MSEPDISRDIPQALWCYSELCAPAAEPEAGQ